MSTDVAPEPVVSQEAPSPPVDPRKQAAFDELTKRAGSDPKKLAALGELGRRYGIKTQAAPAKPVRTVVKNPDGSYTDSSDPNFRYLTPPGKDWQPGGPLQEGEHRNPVTGFRESKDFKPKTYEEQQAEQDPGGALARKIVGPITDPITRLHQEAVEHPERDFGYKSDKVTGATRDTLLGAATTPFNAALALAPKSVEEGVGKFFGKLRSGVNYEPHGTSRPAGMSQETYEKLFPGNRMIPGTQDVADVIGAPKLSPLVDLAVTAGLAKGTGEVVKGVGESSFGRGLSEAYKRGYEPKVDLAEQAKPVEQGGTPYGTPDTKILGKVGKRAARRKVDLSPQLKPQEGVVTPEEITRLRAETRLAQAGDEVPYKPGKSMANMPIEKPSPAGRTGVEGSEEYMQSGINPENIAEGLGRTARWVKDRFGGSPEKLDLESTLRGAGASGDRRGSAGPPEGPGRAGGPPSAPGGPAVGVVDRVRSYGPSGEELGMRLIDHDVDVRSSFESRAQPLLDVWKRLTRQEKNTPRAVWDRAIETGDVSSLTPNQRAYLEARVRPIAEGEEAFNAVGGRIDSSTGPRRTYIQPERYTANDMRPEIADRLEAGDPAVVQRIVEWNAERGTSYRAPNGDVVEGIRRWRDNLRKPFVPGVESERLFSIPPEFKNPDILSADLGHVYDQARATSLQKNFKFRDPETGELRNSGQGDYGDLVARIGEENGPDTAKWIRDTTEPLLGRDARRGVSHLKLGQKLQAGEGVLTNVSKIGVAPLTAASQTTQLVTQAGTIGSRNLMRGLVDAITGASRERRTAVTEGAAPRMARYAETAGLDTPTARLGRGVDTAQNIALSPVAFMDSAMRTVGSAAVKHYVNTMRATFAQGGRAVDTMYRVLGKQGMRPEEIQRIGTGQALPRDLVKLRQRLVGEGNIEARPGQLPRFMSDPNLQSLSRLAKFKVGQTRYYLRNVLDEAARGNVKPLARTLVWSVVMGDAIGEMKEQVTGPTGRRKKIADIIRDGGAGMFDRVIDDLDNSVFLGIIGHTARAFTKDVEDVSSGKNLRFQDSELKRLFQPPIIGTGEDVWDATASTLGGTPVGETLNNLMRSQVTVWRQGQDLVKFHTTEDFIKELNKRIGRAHGDAKSVLRDVKHGKQEQLELEQLRK